MNNDLPLQIIDALKESWDTDQSQTREQSAEVIRAVVEPVIARLREIVDEETTFDGVLSQEQIALWAHLNETEIRALLTATGLTIRQRITDALAQLGAPLAPREGSWDWAFQLLKSGERMTNDETEGYYEFTEAPAVAGGARFLTLYAPDGTPCPQGTLLMIADFETTTWRIADGQK